MRLHRKQKAQCRVHPRMCVLRDYPTKMWSPVNFLSENLNNYRLWE